MRKAVEVCCNCGNIQPEDRKAKVCWYCKKSEGFEKKVVEYRNGEPDYCPLCGASPMTVNCNNAGCDT